MHNSVVNKRVFISGCLIKSWRTHCCHSCCQGTNSIKVKFYYLSETSNLNFSQQSILPSWDFLTRWVETVTEPFAFETRDTHIKHKSLFTFMTYLVLWLQFFLAVGFSHLSDACCHFCTPRSIAVLRLSPWLYVSAFGLCHIFHRFYCLETKHE